MEKNWNIFCCYERYRKVGQDLVGLGDDLVGSGDDLEGSRVLGIDSEGLGTRWCSVVTRGTLGDCHRGCSL